MTAQPIHVIFRRIKPLSLPHQIHHLRSLVNQEKPYSIRRVELEALLLDKMNLQLRREIRADKRAN